MESLNVQGMKRNHRLTELIPDVARYMLSPLSIGCILGYAERFVWRFLKRDPLLIGTPRIAWLVFASVTWAVLPAIPGYAQTVPANQKETKMTQAKTVQQNAA